MTLRLPLLKIRFVIIVNVYAPTVDFSEEDRVAFYLPLGEVVRKIPPVDNHHSW